MSFLAQLLGAVFGAGCGFLLGEMMIVGVAGEAFDMRLILAGVGAVIGYTAGRFIAGRAETEAGKDA